MQSSSIRLYADTSVFGGVYDSEFEAASRTFFEQVRSGRFQLVTSAVVQLELQLAPPQVQQFFDSILPTCQVIDVSLDALQLRQAYLKTGIVTAKWQADALHVALATVSHCPLIVSWNFRHIVHFEKIPLYNAVNLLHGYQAIAIHSPLEVVDYEDKDI